MKKNLLLAILFLLVVPLVFIPTQSSANDFSGDGNAVALWSMDSGVLTTDYIGTNILTDNNTVGTDTVNYQEGDASADFESSNSEFLSITNANLDSGFPLKSGESGTFSVTFWYKAESLSGYAALFSKWDSGAGARSLLFRDNAGTLEFFIGHTSGAGSEILDNSLITSIGRWYHVGATFNNTTKAWTLRVYDFSEAGDPLGEGTGVVLNASGTATNNINISDAPFAIGASYSNGSPERFIDGLIDEVVVFSDILTTGEIDQIRQGTYAEVFTPTTDKLLASDGTSGDNFGEIVSISGDYAIVGARYADGLVAKTGAAYIYYFDGVNWIEQQKLLASDGATDDKFGAAVSISGNYAFVGAVYGDGNVADSGAVYIYYFDGTNWVEQQKLVNNNGTIYAYFGRSIAISGNYAIICESNSAQLIRNLGVAFIYNFDGTNWVEQQQLTTSDGAEGFCFDEVDISGNHAIVGAPLDDVNGPDSGSAYVFFYDGTSWSEQQKLLPSDGGYERDWFGYGISISGNYAVIGTPYPGTPGNDDPGSAYVFHYDGTNWSEQQKLIAYDGELNDLFGKSVAMSGDNVIVGAEYHDSGGLNTAGAAYIFHNDGTNWISAEKLVATDPGAGDRFGFSVSISNNKAIVGAIYDDDNGSNSGSAYIYTDYSTEQVVVDIDNDGYVLAVDCNDRDASVNPGEPEVCNDGKDTDCDGLADINDPDCPPDVDVDNDGYGSIYDCNDNNASVNPGASEDAFGVCSDGLDNDCDGLTDLMEPACSIDDDFDGYPVAEDCDDIDYSVNPGAEEDCTDGIDNDCDNLIDDQDPDAVGCNPFPSTTTTLFPPTTTTTTLFPPTTTTTTLFPPTTTTTLPSTTTCADISDRGACNDDPNCEWVGSPKSGTCQDIPAAEICDSGIDEDGDGLIDCDDPDCAGVGSCPSLSCSEIPDKDSCISDPNCEWVGSPKNGTCEDATVCVPDETPEATCTDGVDNDCDGMTDCADTADCGADPACQGGSCDTYTDKTSCQSNGCTWSNKDKVCM